jgi:N-acetylmuramoyl-L-alanine amidase
LFHFFEINAQPSAKKFVLVIDAGHGGHDPGCHGNKHKEKDVALAVALKLGKYLEENCPDVKVVFTRKTDVFLELNERAKIANDNNADLFICIHCNASPNKTVYGSETYVMGLHKTKGNLDVARRENASILLEDNYKKNYDNFDPNSDEANIIFTMYQNAHLDQSLSLADKIQTYYKTKGCRTNKGVKQAGFLVLWKTSMPSLLTETGFLTNPEEEKFLGSKQGQDYLATSIFLAFRKYKDEIKGIKAKYNDELENRVPCSGNIVQADIPEPNIDTVAKEKLPIKTEELKEVLPNKTEINDSITKLIVDAPKINKHVKTEKDTKETLTPVAKIEFKIQFYNSVQKLSTKYPKFKGVKDISELKVGNEYKYYSGVFSEFSDALEGQKELRKHGFKDAFIVAFNGAERITVKEAMELKK